MRYYPVYDALQTSINVTLEEFIKAFLKQNDYASVSVLAEIGTKTSEFIETLADLIETDETEVIDVVPVEPVINVKSPETVSEYIYDDMKVFIFGYIGNRGGKTLISDLADAFHKNFNHTFTAEDYEVISGSTKKWQHKMYDQVKTMRAQGLINPKGKGKDYHFYSLTVAGFRHYKKVAHKIEKQLELPDMFEEG